MNRRNTANIIRIAHISGVKKRLFDQLFFLCGIVRSYTEPGKKRETSSEAIILLTRAKEGTLSVSLGFARQKGRWINDPSWDYSSPDAYVIAIYEYNDQNEGNRCLCSA